MAKKCKYEKALRSLVNSNQQFMRWLDAEMVKPSTVDRGRRVAQAMNALSMHVDGIRFNELGVNFRRDRNPTFKRVRDG